jgi:hypothetical protein
MCAKFSSAHIQQQQAKQLQRVAQISTSLVVKPYKLQAQQWTAWFISVD